MEEQDHLSRFAAGCNGSFLALLECGHFYRLRAATTEMVPCTVCPVHELPAGAEARWREVVRVYAPGEKP